MVMGSRMTMILSSSRAANLYAPTLHQELFDLDS